MPETITDIETIHNTDRLFPTFKEVFPVLNKKVFKGVCVPDVPVSTQRTRQTVNVASTNKTTEFLVTHLSDYLLYLNDLLDNITTRFNTETFSICISIGKILNLDALFSVKTDELSLNMNPRDITSDDEFNEVIDNLPFASQLDRKHLYVQYN